MKIIKSTSTHLEECISKLPSKYYAFNLTNPKIIFMHQKTNFFNKFFGIDKYVAFTYENKNQFTIRALKKLDPIEIRMIKDFEKYTKSKVTIII